MPAKTVPREARQRRDLLAFQALVARGRDRAEIMEHLHISRPTYYRWLTSIANARRSKASKD